MSNHARNYDKVVALLKSVAAPCNTKSDADHAWRKCRHCLAVQELDHADIRSMLTAFLEAVKIADKSYGVIAPAAPPVEDSKDIRTIIAHPFFALAREFNWADEQLIAAKKLIDITVIRLTAPHAEEGTT